MEKNNNNLESFKNYTSQMIEKELPSIKLEEEERLAFIEEYPLERMQLLSYEEYCLGTGKSKESLCYKMEFGKYSSTGFGIGGGSARKFGVYFNKGENAYKHRAETVEDIEVFWPIFREELCRFLTDSGTGVSPVVLEDYPLLQGMAMVLTKFLCIYYPDQYITIGSYSVLKELMDRFGYSYDANMRCHQLNYYFNKDIKDDIAEIKEYDGLVIGKLAWKYIGGEEKKEHGKGDAETSEGRVDALGDTSAEETHYWMYAAGYGSERWEDYYRQGIMAIGWGEIGDLSEYDSKEAMKAVMKETYDPSKSYRNAGHATWQFANEMKPGDVIFVKRGQHEIVGRGVVTSDYRYDTDGDDDFNNIREVEWTHYGSWMILEQIVQKTLTDITQYTDYVAELNALFEDDEIPDALEVHYDPYSEEDFLDDVFMEAKQYQKLVNVLKQKKNIILEGAPGVGKTYVAKRLAYSIMGVKDPNRVKMVQFHQSYSYEDFIMGFRPTENGFKLHTGAFYDFCKLAQDDKENDYFFIIDEINRGNISKIFGEMFMLIEEDKRGISLGLLYKNEQFSVPANLYIIGMMNTADRSLAMLDYALRRRFAFFDFAPAFGTDSFEEYRRNKNNSKYDKLIQTIMQLNEVIENDESLGEGFRIGHSYFVTDKEITDELLDSIVEYELIPLLKEYWFDEPSRVRDWSGNLRRAIK